MLTTVNPTDLDVLIICIYEVLYQLKFKIGCYTFPISQKPKTSFCFTSYADDMIVPQLGEEVNPEADFMNVLPAICMELRDEAKTGFAAYSISPYFIQIRIDSTLSDRSDVKRLASASAKTEERRTRISNESPYIPRKLQLGEPQVYRHEPKPQRTHQPANEYASDSEESQKQLETGTEIAADSPFSPKFYKPDSNLKVAARNSLDQSGIDYEEHKKLLRDADALINSSADYQPPWKEHEPSNQSRPSHQYRQPQQHDADLPRGLRLISHEQQLQQRSRATEHSEDSDERLPMSKQPSNVQRKNGSRKFEERFGEKSPYLKVQPDYKNPGGSSGLKPGGRSQGEVSKENLQVTTKKKADKRARVLGEASGGSPSGKFGKY